MNDILLIDPSTLARLEVEATAVPTGWTTQPRSLARGHVRYESRYLRWAVRIDVVAMARRPELAFEAVLLTDRRLLPPCSATLLVATVTRDDRSISRAFDLVWQAVAGRRDIENAAHREYRWRRTVG